jgi:hypothetical protein
MVLATDPPKQPAGMALCSSMCLDYAGSAADVTDELAHRRARPCRGSDRRPHLARPVSRTQPRRAFSESILRRLPYLGCPPPSGGPQDVTAPGEGSGDGLFSEAKAAVDAER